MRLQDPAAKQMVKFRNQDQEVLENGTSSAMRPAPHSAWRAFGYGLLLAIVLGGVALLLAPLPILVIMGSLTVALLLGLLWRAIFGLPRSYTGGVRFASQRFLRWGIILTGVRLNFALVVSSGLQVFLLDTIMIVFGVFAMSWLARKLGLRKDLAFLISIGQSICGASAIGAISAMLPDTDEDDISLAVAICGLVGTVGVLCFTFAAHFFGLRGTFYGLLTGSTLHEIAQVVAAGPAGGLAAANLATVTKLTRVMLLAPIAIGVALLVSVRKNRQGEVGIQQRLNWKKVPMPWFVLGFLAVGALNSLGFFPPVVSGVILQASVFLTVVSMAGMGLMVDLRVIRQTGLRALGVSFLIFVLFVTLSSCLIILSH